ncbi:hypothetical protein B0H14DRAFT_2440492, partial [Mycena olivaceomarginata]
MSTPFLPAGNHPRADEPTAATDAFFLDSWPFQSQDQRDLFVRCEYGSFISKSIPDGEFQRMVWAYRACTILFLTDDWTD